MAMAGKQVSVTGAVGTGELIERLSVASVDDLRGWIGRLEDAQRLARVILRERLKRQRQEAQQAMQTVAS
jgi:hypothetical protein